MGRKVESISRAEDGPPPAQPERVKQKTPYPYDAVTKDFIRKKMLGFALCETRAYLYITDHTRGYAKGWDAISWSQFCDGQKDRNGEVIDRGVGFKKTRVKEAVQKLWLAGMIRVLWRDKKANLYAVTNPDDIEAAAKTAAAEQEEWLKTRPPDIGKRKPKNDPLKVAV
jgi:hypothetical protein